MAPLVCCSIKAPRLAVPTRLVARRKAVVVRAAETFNWDTMYSKEWDYHSQTLATWDDLQENFERTVLGRTRSPSALSSEPVIADLSDDEYAFDEGSHLLTKEWGHTWAHASYDDVCQHYKHH